MINSNNSLRAFQLVSNFLCEVTAKKESARATIKGSTPSVGLLLPTAGESDQFISHSGRKHHNSLMGPIPQRIEDFLCLENRMISNFLRGSSKVRSKYGPA